MKPRILALNHSVLFLCVSMYLGTGWSLVLFSFPIADQLTVANYYLQFVPQVDAATRFFTWMTTLMIVLNLVMLVAEWKRADRWVPMVVLAGVLGATGLTVWRILPLNAVMASHITDPALLTTTLERWVTLNRLRVALWSIQWLAMMCYFALRFLRSQNAAAPEAI
jgi:hypothetical protein